MRSSILFHVTNLKPSFYIIAHLYIHVRVYNCILSDFSDVKIPQNVIYYIVYLDPIKIMAEDIIFQMNILLPILLVSSCQINQRLTPWGARELRSRWFKPR